MIHAITNVFILNMHNFPFTFVIEFGPFDKPIYYYWFSWTENNFRKDQLPMFYFTSRISG